MTTQTIRSVGALAGMVLVLYLGSWVRPSASGQELDKSGAAKGREFVVEGYYRAKWGHADEFLHLYKKNHLPILKKLKEEGRILRIEAMQPRYHST
jgi:hypothetical protein